MGVVCPWKKTVVRHTCASMWKKALRRRRQPQEADQLLLGNGRNDGCAVRNEARTVGAGGCMCPPFSQQRSVSWHPSTLRGRRIGGVGLSPGKAPKSGRGRRGRQRHTYLWRKSGNVWPWTFPETLATARAYPPLRSPSNGRTHVATSDKEKGQRGPEMLPGNLRLNLGYIFTPQQ